MNSIIVFIGILFIIYLLSKRMEQFDGAPVNNPFEGLNAAEACKKISSRAEELEAESNLVNGVLQNIPLVSLLNPNNYKAGDATSSDTMRNIINNSMTSEDITKIQNTCSNSLTSVQSNKIAADSCAYCDKIMDIIAKLASEGKDYSGIKQCEIKGVTQSNIAKADQLCMLSSAISTLQKKTNDLDAQAMSKVLQKTQDVLSGDVKSEKDNCNVVTTIMDSKTYLEAISKCSNELEIKQENVVEGCAAFQDIIQNNAFESKQQCLMDSGAITEQVTATDTRISSETEVKQESSGVGPAASFMSVLSSLVFAGVLAFAIMNADKLANAAKTAKGM